MDGIFGDKLDRLLSDEKTMEKIREIADSIGGAAPSGEDGDKPSRPAPPPAVPSKIGGYCAVLGAIRPYLDKTRQERIDKTLRALKMAEAARSFIGV